MLLARERWPMVSHFSTRSRDQGWKNTVFSTNSLQSELLSQKKPEFLFIWSFKQSTDICNSLAVSLKHVEQENPDRKKKKNEEEEGSTYWPKNSELGLGPKSR